MFRIMYRTGAPADEAPEFSPKFEMDKSDLDWFEGFLRGIIPKGLIQILSDEQVEEELKKHPIYSFRWKENGMMYQSAALLANTHDAKFYANALYFTREGVELAYVIRWDVEKAEWVTDEVVEKTPLYR